jgi:hypothetical protein
MKKILLSFIIIMCLSSCTTTKQIVIDLKQVAGKNKSEVDKILGKPDKVEPFKESSTSCKNLPCEKAYYQKDKFEIIFINGKADWITVNNLSEYDFDEDNIEILGLSISEPDFNNPQSVIRWEHIENINEVNIFNDGSNKISYAYIKVATE